MRVTRYAAIDIEVTGFDPILDRIIELRCIEVTFPGLRTEAEWGWYFNPGIPVKPEAHERHRLTNELLKDDPPFSSKAAWIQNRLHDATLIAYNGRKHDLAFLHHELVRAGEVGLSPSTPLIDLMDLFREDCPHTLTGALQYYTGQRHEGAHNAKRDVQAMLQVLGMQLAVRPHAEVLRRAQFPRALDHTGWFLEGSDGVVRFGLGKYRGRPCSDHRDYVRWIQRQVMDARTRQTAERLLGSAPGAIGSRRQMAA